MNLSQTILGSRSGERSVFRSFFLVLLLSLGMTGCGRNEETVQLLLPQSSSAGLSARSSAPGAPVVEVIGNDIFFRGEKRGWIADGRIFIDAPDAVYSFLAPDGVKPLQFFYWRGLEDVVRYGDLRIYLPMSKRYGDFYGMFHDTRDVVFRCDGPFIQGQPNVFCTTNGLDALEQYEFGRDYRQFQTGGGFLLFWRKYFARHDGGETVVFEGNLEGMNLDSDTGVPLSNFESYEELLRRGLIENLGIDASKGRPPYSAEQRKAFEAEKSKLKDPEALKLRMVSIVRSTDYLQSILSESSNKEREAVWRDIANSLEVEKK